MRLSIIISTWNSMKYLPACIESIHSLSLSDAEIIVVDSGSTDGTVEYLSFLPGIRFIQSQKRLAWSDANQRGLDASKGNWLCLSNPDVLFTNGFRSMLRDMEYLGIFAAAPRLVNPDGSTPQHEGPTRIYTPWLSLCAHTHLVGLLLKVLGKNVRKIVFPYEIGNEMIRVDNPPGSFFMVHRKILDRLGGHLWNPGYLNMASDAEAFLNMKQAGVDVWLFPQYKIVHYGSYVTKWFPGWNEKELAYGLALYFRRHPHLSRKISPMLYSILLGGEAVIAVVVSIAGRLVKQNRFFNPRRSAWVAGQRLIGLVDGWRYRLN